MFTKIKEFFEREPINTGRQKGVDILKAVSIFGMVMCHLVLFANVAEEETIGFYLADRVFGSYMGVAHAFMLCMGIGMTFTRKNKPKDFILRGISLLIMAYVLNMLRTGIYEIILKRPFDDIMDYILMNDILQFAALANIVVGILKKLKLTNIHILLIGVVLSIFGIFFKSVDLGNQYANIFVGLFIPTNIAGEVTESTFSFINWFIFVGVGLVFGDVIQRVKNPDKICKYFITIGLPVGFAYFALITILGETVGIPYLNANSFTTIPAEAGYYGVGFLDAIGLLSFDFGVIGVGHFLCKKFDFKFLSMTAKNITEIYFIHWILNGIFLFPVIIMGGSEITVFGLYLIELGIYFTSAVLSVPFSWLFKKAKSILKK